MPSEILKSALRGDDVGLTEMTWLIEKQQITFEDIKFIHDSIGKNNNGKELRYLIACLYYCGAPTFEQDEDKSDAILKRLIEEDNFSYAKNFICIQPSNRFVEKYDILQITAVNDLNPLAIFNFIVNGSPSLGGFGAGYLDGKHNIGSIGPKAFEHFSHLATAYHTLFKTHYREWVDDFLKAVINKLDKITYKLLNFPNDPSQFNKKSLASAWEELANFHKNVSQRYLMFHALQQAYTLKNKYKQEWLHELGGKNQTFDDVIRYLQSFLKMGEIVDKKMKAHSDRERWPTLLFNLEVEFKNCKFLYTHYIDQFSDRKEKELLKNLYEDCKLRYGVLSRNLQQHGVQQEEQSPLKLRLF